MKKLIALFVLVVFSFPSFGFACGEDEEKDVYAYREYVSKEIDILWIKRDNVCAGQGNTFICQKLWRQVKSLEQALDDQRRRTPTFQILEGIEGEVKFVNKKIDELR